MRRKKSQHPLLHQVKLLSLLLFCCLPGLVQARELPDFTWIAEQNMATVATIEVTKLQSRQPLETDLELIVPEAKEESKLSEFFDNFFSGRDSNRSKAIGSGLVISADGYLLTAAHLVDEAKEIRVRLGSEETYQARKVGSDELSDIALLKIEGSGLPTPKFGTTEHLKIGAWVMTIGAPFGFEKSVSQGIISALNRQLSERNPTRFLQTDVAVNPGNSGGPLYNTDGEVIGINTQIYSRSGGYQGVSFAVPIDAALAIATDLKSEKVETGNRSWNNR